MTSSPLNLSVIVPAFDGSDMLVRTLAAIAASDYHHYECIVVDDGSTEDLRPVVAPFPVRLVRIADGPLGPAHARNAGAAEAAGDVIVFVDADVLVTSGTLRQFADTFANHPGVDAVFGSYDDAPATPDFVSQFKNLLHHFVHQHANQEAATFWSGCGAIRRDVFLAAGGFDAHRYRRPSIEDIELGYRLRAAGRRIILNKDIQVKHLKRWTLRGLMTTDIFDRGAPWTRLILERRRLPNDLNLHIGQRMSAMLSYSMLLYLGLVAFFHNILMLPLIAGLFLMVVGAMDWSGTRPLFHLISRRSEFICYGLIAAIASLAVTFDMTRMLPPLAVLFLGILGGRWIPSAVWDGRRLIFPLVLGALAASIGILLAHFSLVVVAPLLAGMLLVVLLNYRLYVFFARKRGLTFAAAALPMHLFYYSYALVSLAIGALQFFAGRAKPDALSKAA